MMKRCGEEVMDSRPIDQDVDLPRMTLGVGEVGDVWIVRTDGGGMEYMRGEEVKSVWNNDDRYVIGNDRRRR